MRMLSRLTVGLLVGGAACTCPKGNVLTAARNVSAEFQLVTATETYAGHATSPPSGQGISFDRSTIASTGSGPQTGTDLILYTMSPGCHPDATGGTVCDWGFDVLVTIHGVAPKSSLPLTIAIDDASTAVQVTSQPPPIFGPCPDKPGLGDAAGKCSVISDSSTQTATDDATYTGLQGLLSLTQLAEDCTDVLSTCALTAQGSFQLTGTGPHGETLSLTSGSVTAADTLMYRDTCPN